MSRKNVKEEWLLFILQEYHMARTPALWIKSIGAKETEELAVMVDTFHPLMLTKESIRNREPGFM